MAANKTEFLSKYAASMGNVSYACKEMNITRQTFRNWMQQEDFAQDIEDHKSMITENVANTCLQMCRAKHFPAIKFYLETKGGWTTKQKIEISGGISLQDFMDKDLDERSEILKEMKKR